MYVVRGWMSYLLVGVCCLLSVLYSLVSVYHLLSVYALFHALHVPPSSSTPFSCFYALELNHAPDDMSGLPHDDKLLWCVVVGDANGIAPVDGIALIISDVIIDVTIPLLYSLDEIVLSAD